LDALKKKGKEEFDKRFFDMVYGKNATTALWWDTGNTEEGDGYKYRWRWFNQITFKANYKKYGKEIWEDLVETPDLLNNPAIAAKAALAFFTDWNKWNALSTLTFDNKEKATTYFANINAGGHISTYNSSALVASQKFDVVSKDLDATTKISTSTLA
jgi:predicted chitinase